MKRLRALFCLLFGHDLVIPYLKKGDEFVLIECVRCGKKLKEKQDFVEWKSDE